MLFHSPLSPFLFPLISLKLPPLQHPTKLPVAFWIRVLIMRVDELCSYDGHSSVREALYARETGHVYKSNHIYPFASYFLYPATKHGYLIVVYRWTNIHDCNPNTHATAYEQMNGTITDIRVIRKCGQHGMPRLQKTKLGRCSPKRNHAGLIFAFGGYFRPSS